MVEAIYRQRTDGNGLLGEGAKAQRETIAQLVLPQWVYSLRVIEFGRSSVCKGYGVDMSRVPSRT